jgi:hypothetical protein
MATAALSLPFCIPGILLCAAFRTSLTNPRHQEQNQQPHHAYTPYQQSINAGNYPRSPPLLRTLKKAHREKHSRQQIDADETVELLGMAAP